MSDAEQPTVEQQAVSTNGDAPVVDVPPAAPLADAPMERPELIVGAAFAGGLALAFLLKRLAR